MNTKFNINDERVEKIISQVEADGGTVLFIFLRGSHCQGTNTETSDEDYGMFYAADVNSLLDLGFKYKDEYKDSKNDVYCQELGKFCRLLLKANPTVLESLFVDDEFVIYEHPLFTELKKYRDMFITKDCYGPFIGYAKSQLSKGGSQNKAVMKPLLKRSTPLDFCFVTHKQGSGHLNHWLEYRGLNQKYCGLVSIANMKGYFGCYYDWGSHFKYEGICADDLFNAYEDDIQYDTIKIVDDLKEAQKNGDKIAIAEQEALLHKAQFKNMVKFIVEKYHLNDGGMNDDFEMQIAIDRWFDEQKPIGYCGIISEDGDSNEVRFYNVEKVEHSQKDDKSVVLCSVPKGAEAITHIFFNKDGYSQHCREWKEQQEWIEHRNPERFRQNVENMEKFKNRKEEKGFYDSKNFAQMMRLLSCWVEIVRDGKYIVNRKNIDRDYLLSIKRGELTYNEIIEKAKEKIAEAEKYMKTCTLPEHCDQEFLNNWLLDVRKRQLNGEL